ncbi:unnamed protein product [Nesidiocoris tenuis]|uniref:RNA-directed DNA polymerase n=2 Tax=Nesidiocoris tenuis TaxID=355587 RepID=A0A6H5GU77_9HEMI|nr:unnamed protein product [Nesidiocoris tenuis]CAB0017648.1 unnamed protein product [Nesidiocoris tenuis]
MDQARKVRVCITNEQNPNDSKSSMHFLKWIQLDGGDVIYEFPPEFQQLNSKHRTLLQIPTVKSVLKTLTRRGSYRIIAITLPATTVPLYFDDNGNSVFEEYYLEEKDLQKWKSETYPVPTGQGPSQLSSEAQNAAILEILQKLTATTEEPQPQRMEADSGHCLDSNAYVNYSESIDTAAFEAKMDHLNIQEQTKINDLIQKFKGVFAKDKFDVGRVKDHEAHIKLYEHKFVSRKPYRCSIPDQKEIESQISQLLKADLIEESTSPFASPVTLAYKREENKKNRLCIDFRELNRLVVPEPQPFPLIEELIAKTRNCTWFTALDINSAFWSIPIRIKDRYKTGFVTQEGHWQWKCLPFGLKTSPAIFQRILNNILRRNNLKDFSMCYLDDILIFSKTFNEHLQHLESLLEAIRNEGFRLKITKCNFARSEVRYLGHIISENTVRPLWGDNLIAIRNFPVPKTRKNVRQFLGKVNFYHKYIENSARLLEPLHNLLRKNAEFVWTEQCQESFESVKKHLCSQPILAIFDPKLKIIIETDASGDGVGAVLKQVQENGEIKPVAYFSKKLKDYQKKKKAIYLECLAMKEAIKFWQHWLVGATFQIITDHKPLEALKINSRSDEELGDMLLFLSQFDFRVTYRPGSTNMEADCLSRNPVIEDYEYLEEFVKTVNFLTLSDITTDQENHSSEFNKIGNTRKESGIIYKIKNTTKRIVISESLADALIKKVHLDFGHIGSAHVIKKIRQFYYTKNLDSKVKAYCQSCELCIKNKTRNSSSYGYLSQLGPARAPFEIVSLDTIGGFAGNRSSKRYLHLLVDHFTRYAFISTSKNQTADDFVKLIKKVQDKHQIKTLLTDQYSGINSAEFKSYLKREGINLIFTAVNNPASNGLNERLNQTLVNRIRCKINSSHGRAWSRIAEECVQEYNSTDHSVTTFSPEYLLFGKTSPIVPNSLEPKSDIIRDREAAFENTIKNHNYNKRLYDRNRRHHDFKEGDLVYVDHSSKIQRNKLEEIRIGPLKITKKISNSIFELDTGHRKKESNMFHVSKLVPVPVGGGI